LVDGDVLYIRDQQQIRLQDKVTLNDGTVINPDGTYQTKDRKRLRLQNGECLDMDGMKYNNEYQYRYKVKQDNSGLSQAQTQSRVHYMLVDGEVYQIRNRSQDRLQQQLNLADGSVINPDGTYMSRDRQQLRLRDGECLNMAGEKFSNTYMHRKMLAQKNLNTNKNIIKKKVQKQPVTPKKKTKKPGN
ncbi:MAG: hypothetical protein Q8J97_04385, partial [Flavobacteriaceae bacterium]|nr:hypothetical protein [Flavobacteriaceae bacterium]